MTEALRLSQVLMPEAHNIALQPGIDRALGGEIAMSVDIDRAHMLMLLEAGLVSADVAHAILDQIDLLESQGFEPLRERQGRRGWYLMYESYLAEQLEPDVAGWLPTARSRNDLSATLAQLSARDLLVQLDTEALELQDMLLRQASRYRTTTMPLFTHGQPALPGTYGHYLAGVASELDLDLRHAHLLFDDVDVNPLGAGAAGGTTLPINPERTAELLGFSRCAANSLAAVASRTTFLRLMNVALSTATLASRVATDLTTWLGTDPPLLTLPDNLVGISSMMPQKRNPYLLEHIVGRAAAPLGALTTLAAGMQKTPFSNNIAVHTEATRYTADAIDATVESLRLTRLILEHAAPQQEAMVRRAEVGNVHATELANQIALELDCGFRVAHNLVGSAVRESTNNHTPLIGEILARLPADKEVQDLDVASIAAAARFGGGPSPSTVNSHIHALESSAARHREQVLPYRERWDNTHDRIASAVKAIR